MASVHLDFVPPDRPDITELIIYESATKTGAFLEIETVTPVGTYPTYISEYTTDQATAENYWFAIQWADSLDARTDMSQPVQGGTTTVVGEVVSRVMLRDPNLNENIVVQTAEWIVGVVMKTDNPYDITLDPTPTQIEGMTLWTLAHSTAVSVSSGSSTSDSWTAGLVSVKRQTGSEAQKAGYEYLLKLASAMLGMDVSRVAQMKQPEIAAGRATAVETDISRLITTEIV